MEAKESVTKLVEENTKESLKEPNLISNLALAERIRNDRKEAKEAVLTFKKIFKAQKMKRCYLALQLLEVLSKNGSIEFHEYLSKDDFLLELIKCFKVLRGKGGLFSKFETKAAKELREKVEDQGLYLLQLWADTFMMYQDTYPGFQRYYRQLKVEGVKFPERDLNERTMMENLEGITSPMFDFVEQAMKKREQEASNRKSIASSGRKSQVPEDKKSIGKDFKNEPEAEHDDKIAVDPNSELEEINEKLQKLEDNKDFVEDRRDLAEEIEHKSYSKYEKQDFDKSEFDVAKKNVLLLESMQQNCKNFSDITTTVIVELFETSLRDKLKCEQIIEVRKKAKIEGDKESELLEAVMFINSKINDFRERYWRLKEREIRNLNRAKRRAEKAKRKEDRRKAHEIKKAEKKQFKAATREVRKEHNPFDVLDATEHEIEGMHPEGKDHKDGSDEESDDDESHSETSSSEVSENESDSDDLHEPKTMHELELQRMEKARVKAKKKRERELNKILKEKEKLRKSKISAQNDPNNQGGFLRNSVLVQKTLNFFGRKSRPLLVKNSEDDEEKDEQLDLVKRKSDGNPQINEYFVQTANRKENDNSNNSNNSQKENIFEQANKEVSFDQAKNGKISNCFKLIYVGIGADNVFGNHEDEESEEQKKQDSRPVFVYKKKEAPGLPPLHKVKSKVNRQSSGVKKIVAPPKPTNVMRKSVLEKPDLLDLLGES